MASNEVFTFSEESMRKLVEAYRESQREYANLKRTLAHFSTRRHQTVYMPGSDQVKVVNYEYLPAAWGGYGTTANSGAATLAAGNERPLTNRMIFPVRGHAAYDINSSGDLEANSNTEYLVNLGNLPLYYGWGVAVKIPTPHPTYGTLWSVIPDAGSHHGPRHFTWNAEENAGDWTLADGAAILIRGSGTGLTSTESRQWAFGWNFDVMLSHYGWYEATFGYRGYVQYADAPYYRNTITTSGPSAGAAHTHTVDVDQPLGFQVDMGLHTNFEAGTTTIGTLPSAKANQMMRNHHMAMFPGTTYTRINTHEKTVLLEPEIGEAWHGGQYMRISPYIKVALDSGASSAGTPKFILEKAWLSVRPSAKAPVGLDGYGAGANQYPSGYPGTRVWYGGGTLPTYLHKDGTAY